MATRQSTARKRDGKGAAANGNGQPTADQQALATALAAENEIRLKADTVREEAGYQHEGSLTPTLLFKLRPLLTEPIPRHYIKHVAKHSQTYKDKQGKDKPWPPHDITGIEGAQVQASRMSNVLGRHHWRALKSHSNNGQLCHVFVIVGNDLAKARIVDGQIDANGAEILIAEDGFGSYNKGPDVGNHYKGSETSGIKRVFGRIGPGEEVYRQEADPELQPESTEAPSGEEPLAPVETIDAERVANLVTTYEAVKTATDDPEKFARDVKVKLGAMGVPTPSLNKAFAALTPGQATELEEYLAERGEGEKGGEQS